MRAIHFILTVGLGLVCAGRADATLVCRAPLRGLGAAAVSPRIAEIERLKAAIRKVRGIFVADPFLWESTPAGQLRVWEALERAFPGVGKVSDEVHEAHRSGNALPEYLFAEVFRGTEKAIAEDDATALDAAYLSLNKLLEIELRQAGIEKHAEEDRAKKPAEPGQAEEKRDEKSEHKAPKPKEEPAPAEYPDKLDAYRPHNKDTDQGAGDPSSQVSIARVNEPDVRLFKTDVFQMIDRRAGWYKVPVTESTQIAPSSGITHKVEVKPLSKKGVPLPVMIPKGFVPVEMKSERGEVWRDESGNWLFRTTHDSLEVPLMRAGVAARVLSPDEVQKYTGPSGYRFEEWPADLRHEVEGLKEAFERKEIDRLAVAKALETFIRRHFRYRVDADAKSDIVDLVAGGAFQCDTAATLFAVLMRDTFKIPTRTVGGNVGFLDPFDPSFSHAVSPSTRHAWAEVADERGNWHTFDPTPTKKDRQPEKKDPGQARFKPVPEKDEHSEPKEGGEGEGSPQPGQGKGEGKPDDGAAEPDAQGGGAGAGKMKDIIEKIKEEVGKKQAAQQPHLPDGDAGHGGPGVMKEQAPRPETDLASLLEDTNPFLTRLARRLLAWATDERLDSATKLARLHQLSGMAGRPEAGQFRAFAQVKRAISQSLTIFEGTHPSFDRWLTEIVQAAPKRPVNDTVDDLAKLQRQLAVTVEFLDGPETKPLRELSAAIQVVRQRLDRVKHGDSARIRIVRELIDDLPGAASRRIIGRGPHYLNGAEPGDNLATLKLADRIAAGRDAFLNNARVMSALGPQTHFLVEPVAVRSRGEARTILRDDQPSRRPRQLLATDDPRDARMGALSLNPELNLDDAFRTGQAVVLGRRKYVPVESGSNDTDPEKMTIIAVDISGSMGAGAGSNAEFQANYVGALVDRALSDVNPAGRARHRVFIVPFDTTAKEPIEVNTADDAVKLLTGGDRRYRKGGGGTNIQSVLLTAADLVKKAESVPGSKALARANVVLCSDGGASVDYRVVAEAFKKSRGDNKDLRIRFGFVGIGGTNPSLVRFAADSGKLGGDSGTYREFGADLIKEVNAKTSAPPTPRNDFWTDKAWRDLPDDVRGGFAQLNGAAAKYRVSLVEKKSKETNEVTTWLEKKSQEVTPNRPQKREGSIRSNLWNLRRALDVVGEALATEDRGRLLEGILREWKSTVNIPPAALDLREQAQLFHLFHWPRTGQAAGPTEGKSE